MQHLPLMLLQAGSTQPQGPDLTRYFTVLGGVLAVLILLAVGLKRLVRNSQLGGRGGKRSLHVVEVMPMGGQAPVGGGSGVRPDLCPGAGGEGGFAGGGIGCGDGPA